MNRRGQALTGPLGGSGMVSLWGASSLIESIQRGTIAITNGTATNTATITAVDMSRARLRLIGYTINSGDTNNRLAPRMAFVNATTISLTVNSNSIGTIVTGSFEVTQYYPGVVRSIQRGTMTGGATAAITAVTTAKTELDWFGALGSDANTNISSVAMVVLTNATTVTATSLGGVNDGVGFQAVEFF